MIISGNLAMAVNILKETSMIKSSRKGSRLHAWWPETSKLVHPMQQQHKIQKEFHYRMGVTTTFSVASVPEILEMKSTTTEAIMGKLKHICVNRSFLIMVCSSRLVNFSNFGDKYILNNGFLSS